MQRRIIETLSEITEEEQYILVQENSTHRSLYAQSGRFIIERRRVSRLSTGEATAPVSIRPHPRFREFPLHSHDFIEIMYVCSGSITHVIDGHKVTLNTDDLIVLGQNTQHSILSAEKNDIGVNLIISTDLFESLLHTLRQRSSLNGARLEGLLRKGGPTYCMFDASSSLGIQNLMEAMIWSVICDKDADGYVLQESLHLLLCYLAAMSDRSDAENVTEDDRERLKKKILNYLRTSYSTATLTEAARMMSLSPSYLSRTLHEVLGVGFKELLVQERFEAAKNLLRTTDMPIGDIINHVGYENSSYFHKEFKRRFGMTPNRYRRNDL